MFVGEKSNPIPYLTLPTNIINARLYMTHFDLKDTQHTDEALQGVITF